MRLFFYVSLFFIVSSSVIGVSLKKYDILFIELQDDIRYTKWGVHPVDIRSKFKEEKRPILGAKLAIQESKKLERLSKINFNLEHVVIKDSNELQNYFDSDNIISYSTVILDLDANNIEIIKKDIVKNKNIIFFNISDPVNKLRSNFCARNFFNSYPSNQMLTDSSAQYLLENRWTKVLMLTGPLEEDKQISQSFKESARKFGLKIINENFFVNSNDPRVRDKNDLSFLTKSKKYDSIFISDTNGEFSLSVPNASKKPALLTGSSGLVPLAWHWSYLRHGAPQLNGRFERLAKRRMESRDWAAWAAVKSLVEATLRINSVKSIEIINFFSNNNFKLDGSKGVALNYRAKTNQLRQTILLVSSNNWVTANIPLESFKDSQNNLDTIGISPKNIKCF